MPTHAPRLLLVEDDAALSNLLQGFLSRAGYAVLSCATGAEALAHWDASFAAAVVDLGLPDIKGEELVPLMLAAQEQTPIVVSSGSPVQPSVFGEHSQDVWRIHVLQKPYLPRHLVELIGRLGLEPVKKPSGNGRNEL